MLEGQLLEDKVEDQELEAGSCGQAIVECVCVRVAGTGIKRLLPVKGAAAAAAVTAAAAAAELSKKAEPEVAEGKAVCAWL